MPVRVNCPTAYHDVNLVLDALLSGVRAILGDDLVGIYLYGSLASGDFDPRSSDIDFVVVTGGALTNRTIRALEIMHTDLWAGGLKWAAKLEGSYIARDAFRRYDPQDGLYPTVNEGRFYVAPHGSDWIIQRHVVREHGVVIAGPPPPSLIDPVQPDDLRRAVVGTLDEWWSPIIRENPGWLDRRLYQAFAVLTMCRVLYTLHHGAIASKPVSARWALDVLDAQWRPLIERALAWPDAPQPDAFDETLAFIRYTLECSQPIRQKEVPSC
jgi:hypothetical protein